ncbi:ISL3 family transposase [Parafrankia sp. FMc6]|uniref:ISL3 family transposase n=1 Tax=Parafrankia soli TaxID=2599596 RepID=UPI0034D4CAA5
MLPHLANVVVDGAERSADGIRLRVHARAGQVACPRCATMSGRVHGRYRRRLVDTALGGTGLVVDLLVRRFRCAEASCVVVTFAEQVEGLTRPHARFTPPAAAAVREIGLALAGRAGARLAAALGLTVGRDTLVRRVRALPDPRPGAVRTLGVDDFAVRRGHVYGTVLIDLDSHRPIDLLPDREADSLVAWLIDHPGVEVICRDRSGAYADGARRGAPGARQVADRWHLWANLCDAVERGVAAHRRCLPTPPAPAAAEPTAQPDPTGAPTEQPWRTGNRFAERTRRTHTAVHALLEAGHTQRAISRQLSMGRHTVRKFAQAARPEDLFRGQWQDRPSGLDPFRAHLDAQWAAGQTNAWKLWEEIKEQGYRGGYGMVSAYVRPLRAGAQPPPPRPRSTRTISRWILTRPDRLHDDEQAQLRDARACCPELDALTRHVGAFAHLLTRPTDTTVTDWITAVRADDLPTLHTYTTGLERDLDAVTAGLTLPHSSGPVEGHVNRIKMIKRQMYGRANFDLLRKRVLLAT